MGDFEINELRMKNKQGRALRNSPVGYFSEGARLQGRLELNYTSEFWFQMFVILISLSPHMGIEGVKREGYKNNNGNYSLGLVPIHRLQPRLLTMPDYCYSDRPLLLILDQFLQPLAFGFCLLQQNLPAVLSSVLRRTSGTKCHSGAGTYFPKDIASVSVNPGPKPFIFWSPVTQSLKERFRFSSTYWTFWTLSSFCSDFGSHGVQTRRSGWSGSCFI